MTTLPPPSAEALADLAVDLRRRITERSVVNAGSIDQQPPDELATAMVAVQAAAEELHVAEEEIRTQRDQLAEARRGRRSQERWRDALWHALPVPVLLTDLSGTLREVNGHAAALLGVAPYPLARVPLVRYVPVPDRSAVRNALSDLGRGRAAAPVTVRLGATKGAPPMVTLVAVPDGPLPADDGPLVRWVALPTGTVPEAGSVWLAVTAALLDPTASAGADGQDINRLLLRLAVGVTQLIPGADAATITLGSPDAATHFAADGLSAGTADAGQSTAGEGPTFEAYRTGRRCHAPDLRAARQWPRLAGRADGGGPRDVLAIPIHDPDGATIGVLTGYAGAANTFDQQAVESGDWLAIIASALLRDARDRQRLNALVHQLERALASRSVIERARGVVMTRCDVDAEAALGILTTMSNTENAKMVDVARRVLESRSPRGAD